MRIQIIYHISSSYNFKLNDMIKKLFYLKISICTHTCTHTPLVFGTGVTGLAVAVFPVAFFAGAAGLDVLVVTSRSTAS